MSVRVPLEEREGKERVEQGGKEGRMGRERWRKKVVKKEVCSQKTKKGELVLS